MSGGLTFTTLVARNYHTCGLATGGTAYCWGGNYSGQLGDGTSRTDRLVPVAVSGGRTYTALTTGGNHTCGLATGGTAYCWGKNGYGQLGDGTSGVDANDTSADRLVPVAVSGGRTYTALAAGFEHTCGLATDGTAYCWGYNGHGQLGDGTSGVNGSSSANRLVPVAVSGGRTYIALVAGHSHTCALTNDGTAYCWGYNGYGQLGDGTSGNNGGVDDRLVPVPVSGGRPYTALAAGGMHTCGLTTEGTAYCWGWNGFGQLGDGTAGVNGGSSANRLVPVAVSGGRAYMALVAEHRHTCGLSTGGNAYCWGHNGDGELGDGTSGVNGGSSADRLVPVAVSRRV